MRHPRGWNRRLVWLMVRVLGGRPVRVRAPTTRYTPEKQTPSPRSLPKAADMTPANRLCPAGSIPLAPWFHANAG